MQEKSLDITLIYLMLPRRDLWIRSKVIEFALDKQQIITRIKRIKVKELTEPFK